jgi:phosphotransferase system, enzyme I, PtsP
MIPQTLTPSPSLVLKGQGMGGSIAWGYAFVHQAPQIRASHKIHSPTQELARFDFALEQLSKEIDALMLPLKDAHNQEALQVIEAYKVLSQDRTWHQQVADRIAQSWSAEDALQAFFMDYRHRFSEEAFWQTRLLDLEDMQNRLLRILGEHSQRSLPGPIILIADHLGPADVLSYRQHDLAGLILAQNQPTAHAVIVAKSLGIPIIIGVEALSHVQAGDPILMDGRTGILTLRPSLDELVYPVREAPLSDLDLSTPLKTLDGISIDLQMNASLVSDVQLADQAPVSGIGLYRTEIPFMMQQKLPTISEQVHLYREILTAARDKHVVFRTLDIGGDKILPYLSFLWEENPGNRLHAFRVLLDRPLLLRYQLRALIRAARGRELRLLLPMIATTHEWGKFKKLIDWELTRETKLVPWWKFPQLFTNFLTFSPSLIFCRWAAMTCSVRFLACFGISLKVARGMTPYALRFYCFLEKSSAIAPRQTYR